MHMIKNANKPEIKRNAKQKPMHLYDSETKTPMYQKMTKTPASQPISLPCMQNSFSQENCSHKYLLNQIR